MTGAILPLPRQAGLYRLCPGPAGKEMGERLRNFELASADGVVDAADWQKHLHDLTVEDWQAISRKYASSPQARLWVEEKDGEFVVHNSGREPEGGGLTSAVIGASDWLAPVAAPAAVLGITSLLKLNATTRLLAMGAGALAGMAWSIHRLDLESHRKMQALPLHIPKESLLNGASVPGDQPVRVALLPAEFKRILSGQKPA